MRSLRAVGGWCLQSERRDPVATSPGVAMPGQHFVLQRGQTQPCEQSYPTVQGTDSSPEPGVTPVQHPASWLWASALSGLLSGRFGQGGGGTWGWQGSAPAATNPACLCSFSTAHLGERRVRSCQGIAGMVLSQSFGNLSLKCHPAERLGNSSLLYSSVHFFSSGLIFFFFFITKNLLKLHIFWHQNSSALGLTGHGLTDAFRCGCRSMIQPIPSKVCLSMHPHAPACWIRCSWRCSVILQWEFPPAPLQCAGTCPQKYFWEVQAWPKDGVCGRHAASLSAESALQIFSVLTEQ